MTEVTRRERLRAGTEQEIRRQARSLLVRQGQDAVTLRAIARELGITAPALYRYYDSREDLLRSLGEDICVDLARQLQEEMPTGEDDHVSKVFAVCRGFRRWALAHPREFSLVFATPTGDKVSSEDVLPDPDRFGRVFLGLAGPLMAEGARKHPPLPAPADLRSELAGSRRALANAFSTEGIDMPADALSTDAVYYLLRWWIRLYGHVALEVFGRFPFAVGQADRLFESMLYELAEEAGMN